MTRNVWIFTKRGNVWNFNQLSLYSEEGPWVTPGFRFCGLNSRRELCFWFFYLIMLILIIEVFMSSRPLRRGSIAGCYMTDYVLLIFVDFAFVFWLCSLFFGSFFFPKKEEMTILLWNVPKWLHYYRTWGVLNLKLMNMVTTFARIIHK